MICVYWQRWFPEQHYILLDIESDIIYADIVLLPSKRYRVYINNVTIAVYKNFNDAIICVEKNINKYWPIEFKFLSEEEANKLLLLK